MSRRTARNHAFLLTYQLPFGLVSPEATPDDALDYYFGDEYPMYIDAAEDDAPPDVITESDKSFIAAEFKNVADNLADIDAHISKFAQGFTIGRLNKIDLAVLRLAIAEMKYATDIPKSVSINEAVELAKKYGADESSAFVNGILGKIAGDIS